jgi:hypothetical protein
MRITAKFGKCKQCNRKFDVDVEEIEWTRENGSYCLECYQQTQSELLMDILEQHALADLLGFDNPPTPIPGERIPKERKAKPAAKPKPPQLKFD